MATELRRHQAIATLVVRPPVTVFTAGYRDLTKVRMEAGVLVRCEGFRPPARRKIQRLAMRALFSLPLFPGFVVPEDRPALQ